VVAQRQPAFLRFLDYADETCAAVVFLLERNRYGHGSRLKPRPNIALSARGIADTRVGGSLLRTDASFAESLYGLRRVPTATSTQPKPSTDLLCARSRWLSLLWLVGVPYAKAKLDSLHATREQRSWLQPSATGAREVRPPPVCAVGRTAL
jgi:hypothetical protein